MQKSSTTRGLAGIKLFFASSALVSTLILWNLFSTKAVEDAQKTNAIKALSPKSNGNVLSNLAPLPTLVPLQSGLPYANASLNSGSNLGSSTPTAQPASALRKISIPTSAILQKPVIKEITINQGGSGGGGGGGGGAPAPAASSGSSR